jgi:thiol-disulfide isomerase/thioredoxin
MKKYLICLSAAIVVTCFCFSAMGQYKIVVKIENNKDTMLLLGNYYLDNTYSIDTAFASKKGFVFEKKNKELPSGIYFFTNREGKFCEFMVDKSKDFTMTTSDEDWTKNMKIKNSEENAIYFNYLNVTTDLGDRMRALMKQKEALGEEEYNRQYALLRYRNDSVKEAFVSLYPNHLLTKVLNCTKPVFIPDSTGAKHLLPPADSISYEMERFIWYKEHYFDNIDLSCGGLLRTPKGIFYSTYDRYWNEIMKYEREDSIILYANRLIAKCTDSNMFRYVVHSIAERYLKSKVMGHEKVYVEMIKRYYKTGKAWWMPPSANEQEVARAEKWENLLLNNRIPNLACPDSNNVWHDVYSMRTKYKLLLFWSPECSHCAVEMPKLVKFYEANKAKYNLEVFAVCTEGTKEEWKRKIVDYDTKWVNVYGMETNMDWRDYFDIETTPQLFILDANNAIIGKKVPAENLEGYIGAIDEGRFKP